MTYQGHSIQARPRLFGKQGVSINYRHVIDSLVRKPGAFAQYKYQHEMFPTSQFRMAYDILSRTHSSKVADKLYVKILELAARESQDAVDDALRVLIGAGVAIDFEVIELMVQHAASLPLATQVDIEAPDLSEFDWLYSTFDKERLSDEQVKNPIPETGSLNHGSLQGHAQQNSPNMAASRADPSRDQELTEQFRELRMPSFRDHFAQTATQAATEGLSHLDYLSELATLECETRREGHLNLSENAILFHGWFYS